jgi:hypothetical protein
MKYVFKFLLTFLGIVSANYNLVEINPNCLNLGKNYCPILSNDRTMDYMSWMERTHQVLVNSMRIDPISFSNKFTNNSIIYACNANKKYPFRFSLYFWREMAC